jgi:hypothetical protein
VALLAGVAGGVLLIALQADAQTVAPGGAASTGAGSSVESQYWASVDSAGDPLLYEAYLAKYPNGNFADLARIKLMKLRGNTAPSQVPPPPPPSQSTDIAPPPVITGPGMSEGKPQGLQGNSSSGMQPTSDAPMPQSSGKPAEQVAPPRPERAERISGPREPRSVPADGADGTPYVTKAQPTNAETGESKLDNLLTAIRGPARPQGHQDAVPPSPPSASRPVPTPAPISDPVAPMPNGYGQVQTPPQPSQNGYGQSQTPPPPAQYGYGQSQTPPPPSQYGYGQSQTPPPPAQYGYGQNQTPPPPAPGITYGSTQQTTPGITYGSTQQTTPGITYGTTPPPAQGPSYQPNSADPNYQRPIAVGTLPPDFKLPPRPVLVTVPPVNFPDSFCSADARNAFHNNIYRPAVEAATHNNDLAGGYLRELQAVYDRYNLSGSAEPQNAVAAESRAYKQISDQAFFTQSALVNAFKALMAVPIIPCDAQQ